MDLKGKCVLLGVTGGIAAYKMANVASALRKLGADVEVIMTQNATQFITPLTFETLTGHKSIFVTHSQGGAVGWNVPADNIAAIVAIEPGGTPAIGSEQYTKLLSAGIPIAIYFGDYIDNGPEDIMSTSFWRQVRDGALAFAAQYNADGGDCTVVDLPKIGITGNSHFMFQELNNKEIADHIYQWLESRALA